MVSALDKKLLRDLSHLKGQVATIALVVACGISGWVASLTTYASLQRSRTTYYERSRFADVWAHLARAPRAVQEKLAAIEGVREVETRIVSRIALDIPGLPEPASASLLSLPDRGPRLNHLYLRSGRLPSPGHAREALLSEGFAQAHGIRQGDSLDAFLDGRRVSLRIVGVALSPEFIFAVGAGAITVDDKRFGVVWVPEELAAAVFDMDGAFNDVTARIDDRASTDEVLAAVDRVLEPWGGTGSHGRDLQPSDRIMVGELQQLEGQATVVPLLFLAVGAFLIHVVMTRLCGMQREQIAALKALGYANRRIAAHYLKLVLVVVSIGVGLGIALGLWLGSELTELYTKYFRFPVLEHRKELWVMVSGAAVSLVSGIVGAIWAVRRAVRVPPAEAMRPEPPARYHMTFLERMGLHRILSAAARMVLRDLERRPFRMVFSSLGIALAIGLVVAGRFGQDAVAWMLEVQFGRAQRDDMTLAFAKALPARAVREAAHLPGVRRAEGIRAVPVRVREGHRIRDSVITGLGASGELHRIVDQRGRIVPIPPEGALLSRKLAEILDVRAGDTVEVEILEGRRERRRVGVAALVDDFLGLQMTMDLRALHRLLREEVRVTSVALTVERGRRSELFAALEDLPIVTGVLRREVVLDQFERQNAEILLVFTMILVAFASAMAAGVVYNNARVALSMRSRELATLRVLGFTRGEVSAILIGEQAAQIVLAIPFGIVLGRLFAHLVASSVDPEMFRLPMVISPATWAFSVLVVLVAGTLSALLVRGRVDRLDLVGVLKAKD